jgi:pimeloyl-ACP methyl ester carboxylesterase
VKAPTLVLWGSADQMIWPSQARYFVEAIPNAWLVTIEGAPHVLSAAVPEEFLSALLAFLSTSGRAQMDSASTAVI